MDLISLLITLIVLGLIAWLVIYIVGLIPMPQPFKIAIYAVLGIIGIVYLLGLLPHPILLRR